jgi:predicted nucleic acid-binding protein
MSDKVFVDTNVLVYAHDVDAGRRHAVATPRRRVVGDPPGGDQHPGPPGVLRERDMSAGRSISGVQIDNPFAA